MIASALLCLVNAQISIRDPYPAYRVMERMRVYESLQRPKFIDAVERTEQIPHIDYNFAGPVVGLRKDGSLFSFRYDRTESKSEPLPNSRIIELAKRYVKSAWPGTTFRLSGPFKVVDQIQRRVINFTPILNGVLADEAHGGWMEINGADGHLTYLRRTDLPLPPLSAKPEIDLKQAQAKILSCILAKTSHETMLWQIWPCELRAFAPDTDAYQKQSRLIYRFYAMEFTLLAQRPGPRWHGKSFLWKIDATSGQELVAQDAGVGGRAVFEHKVPNLLNERFSSIVWGEGKHLDIGSGMIENLAPLPSSDATDLIPIALVGKSTVLLAKFEPETATIHFRERGQWIQARPDQSLKTALGKVIR